MQQTAAKFLSAGTRVKVKQAVAVPPTSVWDEDAQRTSTSVKKRLQQLFFSGDRRVQAEVVHIANESVRDRLRSQNQIKLQLRDAAGATVVITAELGLLQSA